MMITTGLNDPRVSSWEPAKLAATLRAAGRPNAGAAADRREGRPRHRLDQGPDRCPLRRHLHSSCRGRAAMRRRRRARNAAGKRLPGLDQLPNHILRDRLRDLAGAGRAFREGFGEVDRLVRSHLGRHWRFVGVDDRFYEAWTFTLQRLAQLIGACDRVLDRRGVQTASAGDGGEVDRLELARRTRDCRGRPSAPT